MSFFHICRKQKGKAEKHEIETALKRAKEAKQAIESELSIRKSMGKSS